MAYTFQPMYSGTCAVCKRGVVEEVQYPDPRGGGEFVDLCSDCGSRWNEIATEYSLLNSCPLEEAA